MSVKAFINVHCIWERPQRASFLCTRKMEVKRLAQSHTVHWQQAAPARPGPGVKMPLDPTRHWGTAVGPEPSQKRDSHPGTAESTESRSALRTPSHISGPDPGKRLSASRLCDLDSSGDLMETKSHSVCPFVSG